MVLQLITLLSNFLVRLLLASVVTLWFLILPILVLVTSPLRLCVQLLAKLFRPDLGSMLTGLNAVLALDRLDKPESNVADVIILDGIISIEKLRSLVTRAVSKKHPKCGQLFYPELRQVPTSFMGYSFWKNEDTFSVDDHCRIYDYKDLPIGSTVTEDDIRRALGELVNRPWKPGKSPWEYLLVPNLKPEKSTKSGSSTALILKRHHVLGDGMAFAKFIAELTVTQKSIIPKRQRQKISLFATLMHWLVTLRAPWDVAGTLLDHNEKPSALRVPKEKLTKICDSTFTNSVPVDMIKRIRGRFGVTFATVVYTAIARAIAQLLESEGQRVPASLTASSITLVPSRSEGLSNHFSFVFIRLPLTVSSRREHLEAVDAVVQKARRSQFPAAAQYVFKLGGLLPRWLTRIVVGNGKIGPTIGLALFPSSGGDQKPVIDHAEVVDVISIVGLSPGPQGLVINVAGVNGLLRVCAVIDRGVARSLESFQNFRFYLEQELEALDELKPDSF